MDFLGKTKGFLIDPLRTLEASKEDSLDDTVRYYLITVVIFSALFTFRSIIAGDENEGAITIFARTWVFGVIGIFILGLFIHIFVYLVGGRNGNAQTIKAVMYAATPGLLLGWIPYINIIAVIWSLVLVVHGIHKFHEITVGRAIIAVLVPVIILLALAAIIVYIVIETLADFIINIASRTH